MALVNRSALVPYSAHQMYELVNDVEAYPEFVPWCRSVTVLCREGLRLKAKIALSKGTLGQEFTTMNRMVPGRRIDVTFVDGPFKRLNGTWRFVQLGEAGCKVSLHMDFEFAKGLMGMAFGRVFSEFANTFVDAFCRRAREKYGAP